MSSIVLFALTSKLVGVSLYIFPIVDDLVLSHLSREPYIMIRLEELLQQKEKVIVELNRRESRFESDFRAARAKLDSEHAFRIAELEGQINAITTEAQSDKMVCQSSQLGVVVGAFVDIVDIIRLSRPCCARLT